MKTIAQELKVTEFPFIIKDKNNNQIYCEYSDGYWSKREFDSNCNIIYFENSDAAFIWNKIFESGKSVNIKPIGLGARDTLRLEMAFCLYGNDIDDTTSPIEAGLSWITKFSKDFTSKNIFEKQKAEGVTRKLIGFEMLDRAIARHDYPVQDDKGNIIGKVTSGTQSPSLQKAIGMAYVQVPFSKEGTEINIIVRDKPIKAKVVKTPFISK